MNRHPDFKRRRLSLRHATQPGAEPDAPAELAASFQAGFQNAEEVTDPIQLRVLGRFPKWLRGDLIRPGPGTFDITVEEGKAKGSTFTFRHIFDALALVHKFSIAGGRVAYRSAKMNAGTEAAVRRSGALPEFETAGTFAQPPGSGLMGRALSGMKLWKTATKNDVVSAVSKAQSNLVTTLGGKLVVTTMDLIELDASSLQPLRRFGYKDISPAFKGELCCSTPFRDDVARETLSFTLQFVSASTAMYRICVVPDAGEPYVLHEHSSEDFVYMHSFAVTEHFVILVHWPAVIKPMKLLMGQQLLEALSWEPQRGSRFLVFDRRRGGAGLVASYRSEAFYAFHHVNAFEDVGGNIAVDVAACDDLSIAKTFKLKHLRKGNRPFNRVVPKRFLLEGTMSGLPPDKPRPATGRQLIRGTTLHFEMGRIDARRSGLPYRFLYSCAVPDGGPWFAELCKLDVATGKRVATWSPPDHFPGEPIFVPRPGGKAEDDGVLLSVVLEGAARRSFLLVLDAAAFTEVARAPLPFAVPFGFHGNFFAGA